METHVSIIVCAKNEEQYIGECIESILNQSIQAFELIIIDDLSTDHTSKIIKTYNDKRIIYIRNEKWLGISGSRNRGVNYAKGDYVFFTDGDCTVSPKWIEEGLKHFNDEKVVAVEGSIIYVSNDYEPSFSDYVMENKTGKKYMTGNIAFKKKVFNQVGGFDTAFTYFEDRDMALRLIRSKIGEICFDPKMVVYHPQVIQSVKMFIKSAEKNKNRVRLFKRFGDRECLTGRIFSPSSLIKIFFPPLIFSSLFFRKFRSKYDYQLLPYSYIFSLRERIFFWRECIKENVFLI
jgi:glycosyltransferase involved in cell wall biosynthesis